MQVIQVLILAGILEIHNRDANLGFLLGNGWNHRLGYQDQNKNDIRNLSHTYLLKLLSRKSY